MTDFPTLTDQDIHMAALALPMTFMTEQWMGSHVFKIGNSERYKMFAILTPGQSKLTLKTPDADVANLLIQADVAQRNAHLPKGGWVTLKLDRLEADDVKDRLADSHAIVSASFPKSIQKKFGLD